MRIKVSDIETHNAWKLDKWILLNGDNTGRGFHIFYDGKEIDGVTSFDLHVEVNKVITMRVEVFIPPVAG